MASVKAILYKSKKKADGRNPIAIRVTVNRKPKYIFVEWIHEKDWDKEKEKVKPSHPNSKRLNNVIRKKIIEADDLILEAESLKKNYTSSEIKEGIKSNSSKTSFFKLATEHINNLNALGKHNRASSEQGMLNNIKLMLKNGDILFHQIDESFLKNVKVFLVGSKKVSERSVINHYIFIRTLFNKAISNNLVDNKYYPFGKGKVKIKFPESIKIGLDTTEIKLLEEMELIAGTPKWHARNIFLFSFYLAGIRISDVLHIRWNDISEDRLSYKMEKNNKVVSLKIPQKGIDILQAYKLESLTENELIFPELKKANLSNSKDTHAKIRTATKKFNKHLKTIGEQLKIKKKITTHIARHSFGNIAGDKVSPQMLQKLYRHSSINTTMGYQSNFIHTDTDEALESVLDF
jgi:integrase|tara:strand:+ start:191 stop:1405 length:1215 start_codon:yes stop_codon:yes gene_type:complete